VRRLRTLTDLGECRDAWQRAFPRERISDLWEARLCFHDHFRRPLRFVLIEDGHELAGFLPLAWVEETGCYGYFPGETWAGTTWLEQNRIVARGAEDLVALFDAVDGPYHLRYLDPIAEPGALVPVIDEIGYLFYPPEAGFSMEGYWSAFSGKSAKRIRRELDVLCAAGVSYRYDDPSDFDRLVELNISRFGEGSYYSDERFRESFRDLMHLLRGRGWLRMTTVMLGGEVAAVDMGCAYLGHYTLLAGGTHGSFPGVAKLINLRHIEYACQQRFLSVDFLCGDFGWKPMFHLTPRPLYLLSSLAPAQVAQLQVAGHGH